MQELARHFVPAADEAFALLTGQSFEADLFRGIWAAGHFSGSRELNSQGVYALTPRGMLLASTFVVNAETVASVLERALHTWRQLRPEQRRRGRQLDPATLVRSRLEDLYPEGGLVLQAFYRDLPRPGHREAPDADASPFYRTAWNQDFAWFRKDEARALLPAHPRQGDEHEVPAALVRRLATFHLLDHVRGISVPFDEKDILAARLGARVIQADGDLVVLRFEGETHTSTTGAWAVSVEDEMAGRTSPQARGYHAQLLGWGTYSLSRQRFVAFDLVAVGARWGATAHSARTGDLSTSPLGVAFALAEDKPAHRVAPFFAAYYRVFWK